MVHPKINAFVREEMQKIKQIHYIKICFTVELLDNNTLPRDKGSAIRGGTGEYLLGKYCIKDRNCENCKYESDCTVRKVMYSKYDIKPEFITQGESAGYMWECNDLRENCYAGDTMDIALTLFGKSIANLPIWYEALVQFGEKGIGREHVRFKILGAYDQRNIVVDDESGINYGLVCESILGEYIQNRKFEIFSNRLRLQFISPVALKHNGEIIKSIDADVLYEALCRRCHMLACYEGVENKIFPVKKESYLEITQQNMYSRNIRRYSNHSNKKIVLEGIIGNADIGIMNEGDKDYLIELLIAGELTHLGKNTSMGFGVYRLINEYER